MKALIGVMPLWDDEKESIWMLPGYLDGIQKAGGIPIVLPLSSDEGDLEHLVKCVMDFCSPVVMMFLRSYTRKSF